MSLDLPLCVYALFLRFLQGDRSFVNYPSSVTFREGDRYKPDEAINTSYTIRKKLVLDLLLEKNRAMPAVFASLRLLYKSSRIQKWQMFLETDRRGIKEPKIQIIKLCQVLASYVADNRHN